MLNLLADEPAWVADYLEVCCGDPLPPPMGHVGRVRVL